MVASTNWFLSTRLFFVISVITFTSVLGCGQLPQGEVTAMTFTASGFTLPVQMAYSDVADVQNRITSISHTTEAAMKVISDLIMNGVNDVLQEQGRNALLPDALISQILQQLNVTVEYMPLKCPTATTDLMNQGGANMVMKGGCFISDGQVISLCTDAGCKLAPANMIMHVAAIPTENKTVKGSLKTSNVIMASWSKQMWQRILNRVYKKLTTARLGKHFNTAVITVNN